MDDKSLDEQALLKLVEQDSLNSFGHRKLGELYRNRGDSVTALKHYRAAVAIEPEDLEIQLQVAMLAFQSAEYEEANRRLKEIHDRSIDTAKQVVEQWLELVRTGYDPQALSAVMVACRLLEDLVGEAELLRNLPFEKRTREQGLRLGEIYLLMGQTSSALAALKKIPVEHDLLGVRTVVATAEALAQSGLSTMAFEKLDEVRLEKIVFLRDDMVEIAYRIGNLYELLGLPDQALKHFKCVIKEKIKYSDALSRALRLKEAIGDETLAAPSEKIDELSIIPDTFKNIKLIGRGGMGSVYSAFDTIRGEIVAIKVISAFRYGDARSVDRFLREAQAMQVLNHPHVLKVHRVHRGAYPFMVLEYVDGENLRELLTKKGLLPVAQVKYIATQVSMALHHAHTKGIVHRDLKPDNIMLDKSGNVKVMDFGLAEAKGSLKIDEGTIAGTIYYMSPEQLSGEHTDVRSDIYSFGIMLFELLTGLKPFPEGDIAYRHQREEPQLPISVKQILPLFMEEIMLRCLEKLPERRYQSWHAVLQDLRSEKNRGYQYRGYKKTEEALVEPDVRDETGVTAEDRPRKTELPGILPARFQQVRAVGSRGRCEEFKAYDITLGKPVRVMRVSIDNISEDTVSVYHERLKTLVGKSHPNILGITDYVDDETALIIITENPDFFHLEGRRVSRLPDQEDAVWDLAAGIGRGVAWLHKQKIVHGALSPFVIWTDGLGSFKVGIFSVPEEGKEIEDDLTDLGRLILVCAGDHDPASKVMIVAKRAAGMEGERITNVGAFLEALAPTGEQAEEIVTKRKTIRKGIRLRLTVLITLFVVSVAVLGVLYRQRVKEQETAVSMLVESDQKQENRSYYYGLTFMEKGNHRQAVIEFEKALDEDPDNNQARYYLSRLLVEADRAEEALPLMQSLIDDAYRSDDFNPLFERALLQVTGAVLKRGDYIQAAKHIDRAIAHGFTGKETVALAVKTYNALAQQLAVNDALMDAVTYYFKALKLADEKKMYHAKLGKCFQRLGNEKRADEHFRTFLELGGTRQELRKAVFGDNQGDN